MLIAQKTGHPSPLNNSLEQLARNVRLEQPIAVLAESRVIPHRLIDRQPDEPSEQHVLLELLDQQPSLRIEYRTCGSSARISRSGAIEGLPV